MNGNSEVSDIYFVFANTLNHTCWHNLKFTKSIFSAGFAAAGSDPEFLAKYLAGTAQYAPYSPNPNISTSFRSQFSSSISSNYELEYQCEHIRVREFARAPSRLSCIYAFKDYSECELAHQKYRWPLNTVRRFKLIPTPLNRVWRANMEIVSLMRGVYTRAAWDREHIDRIWRAYWSGSGSISLEVPGFRGERRTHSSGEIWEYLIEGRLNLDEDLGDLD